MAERSCGLTPTFAVSDSDWNRGNTPPAPQEEPFARNGALLPSRSEFLGVLGVGGLGGLGLERLVLDSV